MKHIADFTLRVWLFSVLIGSIGFFIGRLFYHGFENFKGICDDILMVFLISILSTLPVLLILLIGNYIAGKLATQVFQFKLLTSALAVFCWLMISFILTDSFLGAFKIESLVLFPHIIGWLFGIWYCTIHPKTELAKQYSEDILDAEI